MGGGAAAAGALSLLPNAAAFDITSDKGLKYFNQSSSNSSFEVGPSGTLDVNQIGSSSNPIPQTFTDQVGSNSSKVENIHSKTINTEKVSNTIYASSYSGSPGGEKIQKALDGAAASAGPNIVVVDGLGPDDVSGSSGAISDTTLAENAWELSKALKVPSFTNLVFNNCYVFLSDGADDNLIRNSDLTNGNVNISIKGRGTAILDGNAMNQTTLSKRRNNQGLRLYKVNDLDVQGFEIRNTASWALRVEDYSRLYIDDITFDQDGSKPNQDGVHLVGPDGPGETNIGEIRGGTDDDLVAVCGYDDVDTSQSDGTGGDITRVNIGKVSGHETNNGGTVRIYTSDGFLTKYINIGDVIGTSFTNQTVVRVGAQQMTTQPTQDELGQINFDSVVCEGSGGNGSAVVLASPCSGVAFDEVNVGSGFAQLLYSESAHTYRNIQFNGGVSKIEPGHVNFLLQGTYDGFEVNDFTFSGAADQHIKQPSSGRVDNLQVNGVNVHPPGAGGELLVLDGEVNQLDVADVQVAAAWNVFNCTGSISGTIQDVKVPSGVGNAIYASPPTGGLKWQGGIPPLDVRVLDNVKGSRAYHDGSGSNTAGPAVNDGAGWTSLVDGSAIS